MTEREDEFDIARLLRAAGNREAPPPGVADEVRASVRAEWLATVKKRSRQRVRRALSIAASVALASVVLWIGHDVLSSDGVVVASASRQQGTVQVRGSAWPFWKALAESPLRAGDSVRTGANARLALAFPDGLSLRLDENTRLAIVGAEHVRLREGAVYVDSGAEPGTAGTLHVETRHGTVRHSGTQYEARMVDTGLRIRVREGRVDLMPEDGAVQPIRAGEELRVSFRGQVERGAISPSDPAWQWAVDTAPIPDIDGMPAGAFLAWVARETGRELVFATPETRSQADGASLSGSVSGLSPREALDAVLPATGLRTEERADQIVVMPQ